MGTTTPRGSVASQSHASIYVPLISGASLCARTMICAPEGLRLYSFPLKEEVVAQLWQPGRRDTVQPQEQSFLRTQL